MRYFLILLAVAFWGCRAGAGSHEGHEHDHEGHSEHGHDHIVFTCDQAVSAGLETETVGPSTFHQIIKTSGQVLNSVGGEAIVAATSSGIVSFVRPFTEGAAVLNGQALAVVSARSLADGDPLSRARIELDAAEREYRRAETLSEGRIISQKDLDEAKRRYETARTTVSAGSGRATSPLTGYVKDILVNEGEYVSAGQAVATVVRNDIMQLRAEVPERYFDALSSVTGANFRTSYGAEVYHADKLLSYGRASDGAYIPVIFDFANDGGLVSGSFAEVWLLGAPRENVLSVPRSALSEEQGLYFVYVRHGDEDFVKQEVVLGDDNGERVRILDGLSAGDVVVTKGVTQVRLAAMSGIIPEGHSH